MTERKWTPGPWHYRPDKYDDWGYVRASQDADGWRAFICQAKDARATEDDVNAARINGTDPWEANARLIATAPDLYEANDWLIKVITDLLRGKPVRDADEAISFSLTVQAKARGEQ